MELCLRGKVAVVTGGSKGIGFSTAKAFLEEGAKVAICARRQEELDAAQRALAPMGQVFASVADATDEASVDAFAQKVAERWGGVHCWVNNVGASFPRAGEGYTLSEVTRTEEACFHSAIFGCQAAFRRMKENGGAIVNVSSLAARCGTAGRSTLYGPLKAAVCQLSVMLAAEYAPYHVRVNAVLPGFTLTPAVERTISPEELERNAQGTLIRRPAQPMEIARPIVFLCGDAASYITGASLEISGGRSVVLNPDEAFEQAGGKA